MRHLSLKKKGLFRLLLLHLFSEIDEDIVDEILQSKTAFKLLRVMVKGWL